jgi:hypothetical protein
MPAHGFKVMNFVIANVSDEFDRANSRGRHRLVDGQQFGVGRTLLAETVEIALSGHANDKDLVAFGLDPDFLGNRHRFCLKCSDENKPCQVTAFARAVNEAEIR